MASTITGEAILAAALQRSKLGLYIPNAHIGAIAASTITSVLYLRNSNWGTDRFLNLGTLVYRPGAASLADYVRYATTVTSAGVLSVDASWADTTLGSENAYLFYNGLHPAGFMDALNRAMKRCYFRNFEPLSAKPAGTVIADAGFQSTATSSYVESDADGGAATTFTKVTTGDADTVYTGIGSGRVLNAATGGYIRHRFNVTEGEQVIAHALSSVASGTNAQHILRDVTNSAAIGDTVSHSQKAWQWTRRVETIPSGCKSLEVRYGGEGTTDDINWNAAIVLFPERDRVILDTKWDTQGKMPELFYYPFGGTPVSNNVWPAMASANPLPVPKDAYSFHIERPGANPDSVVFHGKSQHEWFNYPLYVGGRRAYSDLTTFTLALSETTAGDLDLITSLTMIEWLEQEAQGVPNQAQLLRRFQNDARAAAKRVEDDGPEDRGSYVSYGIFP